MPATTNLSPATLQDPLLRWFNRHRRDLPWRETRDPYAVWLSEVMLQQTQVTTVIPYYERFLRRFPTVVSVADASLREVLRYWAGLGYYARARHFHSATRVVRDECGGRVPDEVTALRRLPGVGRYTAGAIASIAYDRREAVVDGNVARVLSRVFDLKGDVSAGSGHRQVWRIAESLVPSKRCGDFNQALMELGATVCLPGRAARCESCPLESLCLARRRGHVARRPAPKRKSSLRGETHVVAVIRRGDRVLVRKRPPHGLWGGLWELPSEPFNGKSAQAHARRLAESLAGRVRAILPDGRRSACGGQHTGPAPRSRTMVDSKHGESCCDLTRVLSHRRIRLIGFAFEASKPAPQQDADIKWVRETQAIKLGMSKAMSEVMARIASNVCRKAAIACGPVNSA